MTTKPARASMRESAPKPMSAVEDAAAPKATARANSITCHALAPQASRRARPTNRARSSGACRLSGAGFDTPTPVTGGVAEWRGSSVSATPAPRPFMAQVLQAHVEQEPDVSIVERVEDVAAASSITNDPPGTQQPEVVRAGGLAQSRDRREIADAELAALKQGKDEADAACVGEDPEGLRKLLGSGLAGEALPDGGSLLRLDAFHLAAFQGDDGIGNRLHRCEDNRMSRAPRLATVGS